MHELVCAHLRIRTHTYVNLNTIYIYIYIEIYIYNHTFLSLDVQARMYVCTYIYIYIEIFMYICARIAPQVMTMSIVIAWQWGPVTPPAFGSAAAGGATSDAH